MEPVVVLYEDSSDGAGAAYGLHELVRALVAERVGVDVYALNTLLRGWPRNGNGNVLRERDIDRLAAKSHVVLVLDRDKVHRLDTGLQATMGFCKTRDVLMKNRVPLSAQSRVEIVLLNQNTESVIEAVRSCGLSISQQSYEAAVRHKDLNERDRILAKAALDRGAAGVRKCVLGAMPSLDYLVGKVAARLTS